MRQKVHYDIDIVNDPRPHGKVRMHRAPEGALRPDEWGEDLGVLDVRMHRAPEGALRPYPSHRYTSEKRSECTVRQKVHYDVMTGVATGATWASECTVRQKVHYDDWTASAALR